jgi:hypothetical protein
MGGVICSRCGIVLDSYDHSDARYCVDCAAELASDDSAPLLVRAADLERLAAAERDRIAATRRTITVEVSEGTYALLAVLGKSYAVGRNGDVEAVVRHLLHSAADGVRRPGSWERSWIAQAFGDDWEESLEVDPDAEWRRRPRGGL